MSHLARRVLLTATTVGALGLALAGCGAASTGFGSGTSTGNGSGADTPAALDCSDLKKQVDKNAPNATASFSEFDPGKLLALASWAAENGKGFEDSELGSRVTKWGEQTPRMEEYDAAVAKNDNSALDKLEGEGIDSKAIDAYEDNSNKINTKCPDIGFGITPS